MHELVQLHHLTRTEFLRGLNGVSDDDARRRLEPMNCISWIVGHLAHQERSFFVAWPRGEEPDERYGRFGYGRPASQSPLGEVMALLHEAAAEADKLLDGATEAEMQRPVVSPDPAIEQENLGTRLARNIFHYWLHAGEISAIRQQLGHGPP
ncbi:MAG: DinB family protein, partial [Dehalococcoidia bacterium]|nr:DinB family protein [Dehalococcoidia bacterium]